MSLAMNADKALKKLIEGNKRYVISGRCNGDVSGAVRRDTAEHGQLPYAVVITCSDSRVIPEAVFSAGIGDLFVIRLAGNVIDKHQLGSVEYAAEHLGTRLVVVLGHTGCGAVEAAMTGSPTGFIGSITDEIKAAIGSETDPRKASCLNVMHSVQQITENLNIPGDAAGNPVKIVPAIYDISTGKVELL